MRLNEQSMGEKRTVKGGRRTVEFMDNKEIFQKPEDKEETKTEFMRWKVLTGRKGYKKD